MEVKSSHKQTNAGVIPKEWSICTGLELTSLIGKGGSPRWQGFTYTNDGMLFVTSENVRDGFLDISEPKYLPLAFHEKLSRTRLRKGDILINLVGASIGRSCQIKIDIGAANVNQAVALFRVKEGHSASFIAHWFHAPTTIKRILEMQVDAARPNVSLGDLRGFSIPNGGTNNIELKDWLKEGRKQLDGAHHEALHFLCAPVGARRVRPVRSSCIIACFRAWDFS
jgi:type I restriction enzyme S subunit